MLELGTILSCLLPVIGTVLHAAEKNKQLNKTTKIFLKNFIVPPWKVLVKPKRKFLNA